MIIQWIEIAVTALITVLLLLVEHYWPWRQMLQRELHPTANYVLGILAIHLPLTGLFILWGLWQVVLATWLVIVCGGLAVIGVYGFDGWIKMRFRAKVAGKENATLRRELLRADDDQGPETA